MLAVEAFPAVCFHIHSYSIARFHMSYFLPYFIYDTHHFMSHSNSGNGTRNRTMLDMQIAGTDTAHGYSHDGIVFIYQDRFLLFGEAKYTLFNISKCFHYDDKLKIVKK